MASDSKQNLKTLRVDNWAVFFLQRLQLLFAKGDCCDLILKFHTGQELKVHRLVLVTCTPFFESMEKEGNVITMPENLPYNVVQPIINFLYSGKLEFKSELHPQLLSISKDLNITILAKLLVTQKNENGLGSSIMKPAEAKKPQRTFLATRIGPAIAGGLGGRKLPVWRQRNFPMYRPNPNRVFKDEEPKPMRFEWPEGKVPTDTLLLASPSFTPLSYESEPVFGPFSSPVIISSEPEQNSVEESSYKRKAAASSSNAVAEKLFKKSGEAPSENVEVKTEEADDRGEFSDDDGHFETIHNYGDSDDEQESVSPAKSPKPAAGPLPMTPIQTYKRVPKPRTVLLQTSSTPIQVQKPDNEIIDITQELSTPPVPNTIVAQTPKPILKAVDPHSPQTASKKVRFSIADESETSADTPKKTTKTTSTPSGSSSSSVIFENQPSMPSLSVSNLQPSTPDSATPSKNEIPMQTSPTPVLPLQTTSAVSSSAKSSSVQTYSKPANKVDKKTTSAVDSTNHAKIIAEVLKKYPDLVKNNKNIRLKISAPGSSSITNTLTLDTKQSDGKAYVVVKSSVKVEPPNKPEQPPAVKSAPQVNPSQLTCSNCTGESAAVFENYDEFIKHYQEAHSDDSKTCGECGYKTSKRNLFLYHMFIKHNFPPPKRMQFPKCGQCGYVASSSALLQKHVVTHHKSGKAFPCPHCEAILSSQHNLQTHLASCTKTNLKESHICMYCNAAFDSAIILDSHVKSCSSGQDKDPSRGVVGLYNESGPSPQRAVEVIEVPMMNNDGLGNKGEHTYVQLPSGLILTDASNVALLQTAEGGDMNAVSNNMAGQLGLTMALPQDQHVILLDANSEFFIQGNEQVVVTRMNSSEEYIVPEVLDESMQQIYSTHALPYSVATTSGNMIACPVVSVPSSSHAAIEKPDDTGSTVVRVQDHVDSIDVNNMQIQHHANASNLESIIVHEATSTDDLAEQQGNSNQVDIYMEEPQPVRHHMAINQELMDVVAMEVQRSPVVEPVIPEAQHETVLRHSQEVVVSSANVFHSTDELAAPEEVVPVPVKVESDSVPLVLECENETASADGQLAPTSAKADSLVKDWGFDNEEENDAGDVVAIDSDSDDESRTGPSRVTVEL